MILWFNGGKPQASYTGLERKASVWSEGENHWKYWNTGTSQHGKKGLLNHWCTEKLGTLSLLWMETGKCIKSLNHGNGDTLETEIHKITETLQALETYEHWNNENTNNTETLAVSITLFLCTFWSITTETSDGNVKFQKKKSLNLQKCF